MFDQPSFTARIQSFIQRFLAWPWARACGVCAIAAGILLGGFGVWLGLQSGETVALATTQTSTECISPQTDQIRVDVSGAVQNPGVYELASGSRGSDAVAAAGGFSDLADTTVIATEVNLAQKLSDGAKLLIPFETSSAPVAAEETLANSTTISINTASAKELESLPGIGAKRAADIITNRPYGTIDELLTKAGLTEKLLSGIEGLVRL